MAEGSGVGGVGSEGMVIACIRLPLLVLLVYFLLIVQRVRTVYFFYLSILPVQRHFTQQAKKELIGNSIKSSGFFFRLIDPTIENNR